MKIMLLLLGSVFCLFQVSSAHVPYSYFDFDEDGISDGSIVQPGSPGWAMTMGSLIDSSGSAGIGSESPDDHVWYDDPGQSDIYNEMLQLFFQAGGDTVIVTSLTLQASGTGDDATDITRIRVVHDVDGDGEDDADSSSVDLLLGAGTYPMDNGTVTLVLDTPWRLPPSGLSHLLFSYQMTSGPCPKGATYRFSVIGAQLSGVSLLPPIPSCTKTCGGGSSAGPAPWGSVKSMFR